MNQKFQKLRLLIAVKSISHIVRVLFFALFLQFGVTSIAHAETEINVYSESSKVSLVKIPRDTKWSLVENQKEWRMVRFSQPLIPAWVSADYVNFNQEQATVRVARLNVRTEPSIKAPVIGIVSTGYSSRVLARSAGFIQIYTPAEWIFALRNSDQEQSQTSINAVPTSPASEVKTSPAEISVNDGGEQPHRLAPGDTISLLVFGEPELSAKGVRIPQSGTVSFPLIGSTEVQGKTTHEIEQLVAVKLAGGFIKNPQLSVTIDGYRPIFIRGAVASTGEFPFSEGLTVVKVISMAGGKKNSAKDNGVSILRDGVTVYEGVSTESQIEILSGDIISIEEELGVGDESTSYVYLHGEVQKPGEYAFRRGLTVEKAVVLAGGFTLRASKRKISLSRMVDGELEPEKLRRVKLYLPIQPGDIINVGASFF